MVAAAGLYCDHEWKHQHEGQALEHLAHALHKNHNYSHHVAVAFGPNQSQNHSAEEPPVEVPEDNRMEEGTVDSERDMALLAVSDNHSPSSAERNTGNRVVDPTVLVVRHVTHKPAEDNCHVHVMALEATKTNLCINPERNIVNIISSKR